MKKFWKFFGRGLVVNSFYALAGEGELIGMISLRCDCVEIILYLYYPLGGKRNKYR